jgi:hypothetical protein
MPSPKGLVVTVKGKEQRFPMRFWRRAITAYLDAVWAENPLLGDVSITIRGNTLNRCCEFYGFSAGNFFDGPPIPKIEKQDIILVDASVAGVEIGLIRLVRNKRLCMLVIHFPTGHNVCVWQEKGTGSEPICSAVSGSAM